MDQQPPPDSPSAAKPAPNPTRDDPLYGPIPLRYRHDGWVPDRQMDFIAALAETGCVDQAAKQVGMSRASAYALRRRPDAQAFRLAWDAAIEQAVDRLAETALARAINGVPVPIYHKGEQVGERRLFNERLTMFLLRTRHAARYGQWIDREQVQEYQEARSSLLHFRITRLIGAAWRNMLAALDGRPQPTPMAEPLADEEEAIAEANAPLAQPSYEHKPYRPPYRPKTAK